MNNPIELKDKREDYCEELSDFLLSYLIPKNKVTALMYSGKAPKGLARTETAVVMTAFSTAKKILFISLVEDTCTVERKFQTLPYEYMVHNSVVADYYEKKSIHVIGRDGNMLGHGINCAIASSCCYLGRFLEDNDFDFVVIDDIVETLQENHVSPRIVMKELNRIAEETKTTIMFTADTRYSDHAMLSLPCSVIDVRREPIISKKDEEAVNVMKRNDFMCISPDYDISFRNERNDYLFDLELYEYGNWIRLDELCEFLIKYSSSEYEQE